ncbi:hypothetical protein HU200_038656 [Digitaria exilis]|uniref:RING-type domain-containing protein n=1 Tax=Digitaria exilis TaxID=1010633 RepID=A0A835EL77_9POAL|nr:hypothetical protein HU200_038656 [Digitaria exilis]
MAVQAQHLAHAFHHASLSISRPAPDNATTAFISEPAGGQLPPLAAQRQQQHQVGGHTVFSDPLSELTCNNLHDSVCFEPRKRARTGGVAGGAGGMIMDGHRAPQPVPVPAPQPLQEDARSRVLCSVDASTSGRLASHGVLSHLHRHSVEIDALVRIEARACVQNERLRSGLEEARRRHVRAVVSSMERAAARRLRDAEADLERALARGAELGERLRQVGAEGQAWRGIAGGHEAAAAGLRATLDQLLRSPPPRPAAEGEAEAEAEDARSCCFGSPGRDGDGGGGSQLAAGKRARACRSCGEADACVLLLPCRHLCLCGGCEAAVEACPVCAATKNASLHVLLS